MKLVTLNSTATIPDAWPWATRPASTAYTTPAEAREAYMNLRIGPLWIHRLEQWDLDCWPIVCVHWKQPNRTRRIFCLWRWGIQVRSFRLSRAGLWFGRRLLWRTTKGE